MLNRFLNHLEEWLIAFLMGAATIVIFVQVVHRYLSTVPGIQDYVLHINLGWAQELCIYMFVWMCKFGAAYGVRTGIHVGIDVLVNRLPVDWRKRTVLLALIGGALFTGIVGALGTASCGKTACTTPCSTCSAWPPMCRKGRRRPISSGPRGPSIRPCRWAPS